MNPDLLVNGVSAVNAVAILVSVWFLSGGQLLKGSTVMLVASSTGMLLGMLVSAWPLVAVNIILFLRGAWILLRH